MENGSEYDEEIDDGMEISENSEEEFTIIIDIGQGTTNIGYAGDPKPRTFPTVVGKPKYQQRMAGVEAQELYVGDDTITMRGVLKLEYPILRGQVMDWNHYYALLNHIFYNALRIDPKKCNVIYLVPPLTPQDSALYFARVLFETHQCKTVSIIDSAITTIFSVGETTGLCIEIGEGLTTITPVMDGRLYIPSIQRLNLAGSDILNYLQSLLSRYGIMHKKEILQEIKETSCKIALDPESAAEDNSNDAEYILPDGETVKINAYIATWTGEVLFQPGLLGYVGVPSLPEAIINSIRNTHPDYWRKILKTIVFAGGTSQFNGLRKRLIVELEKLIPQLGPIPEKQKEETVENIEEISEPEEKKMVQVKTFVDSMENCPKCGDLLDGDNKFCPNCGEKLERNQIDIIGAAKQTFAKECSKCSEKLDGESPFCPSCGAKIDPIVSEEQKIKRKEKKLVKKTQAKDDELESIMAEVSDEYGDCEDIDEEDDSKNCTEDEEDENTLIKIITSEDQTYAGFKGASILGALPVFKQFMITYEQYQKNPESVLVDFSQIVDKL